MVGGEVKVIYLDRFKYKNVNSNPSTHHQTYTVMGPKTPTNKKKPNKQKQPSKQLQGQKGQAEQIGDDNSPINLSTTLPISLQQLLLNTFKSALFYSSPPGASRKECLDLKSLIQSIKAHLYNRDFDSAFADAGEDVLRAYALRWSAARALGYAGVFRGAMELLLSNGKSGSENAGRTRVVCVGGGAGAEIIALAAVWRDLIDGARTKREDEEGGEAEDAMSRVSLDGTQTQKTLHDTTLSVTAVDIADWSAVVDRLAGSLRSTEVPSSASHPAPLLPAGQNISVDFQRSDVLSLSDQDLNALFNSTGSGPTLVTLMFTLNELFSTSMAKATSFLLRMTDSLSPGTVLLVVDSPGSYSTLKLGGSGQSQPQEREYPMKFLLDHTLLSVAKGKWEKVFSQDSRWWRRDAAKLRYEVGEGAGLEDMRFQIHIYRRLPG